MNKNELRAAIAKAAPTVEIAKKANLDTLRTLYVEHVGPLDADGNAVVDESKLTPPAADTPPAATGTGLKIEKDRPEQNGIKRPSAGGRCRAVWDALDAYQAETGELPTAKVVRDLAADEGWNPNNASIEFYQWRKYHGITGRQPKPAAEPAAAAE